MEVTAATAATDWKWATPWVCPPLKASSDRGTPTIIRPTSAAAPPFPDPPMTPTRATGRFDVKLVPQQDDPAVAGPFGRMLLDKHFHGDLDATSNGQMLAGMSPITGSAAYVAMEQVTGTLHGRQGVFMLHHTGIMNRGETALTIAVVPDSGSHELTGLTGTMQIIVEAGTHSYIFDYILPTYE